VLYQLVFFILGDIPVRMTSDDPIIIAKVNSLREKYMTGNKLFIKKAIDLLAGDEDEESFMTTFSLVLLGTIVCPCTSDTVDWKILYSLTDVSMLRKLDWNSLCLQCIINEVGKFVKKMSIESKRKKLIYVGGCLPALAVSTHSIFLFLYFYVLHSFLFSCVPTMILYNLFLFLCSILFNFFVP
jgi:hypothetical protein